jgi:signal transduction histidine kinase
MRKSFNSLYLTQLLALSDAHLIQREHVGTYIHSFGALIADRMINHYLVKNPIYQNILSSVNASRLIRIFGEYFSSLFIHPFDERLIDRMRQVSEIHISIGLEAIHLSRGFDILNEIIMDLAKINKQISDDLPIIIKMVRIAESVMQENYRTHASKHQEELQKENEILHLFDVLYASLTIHKQSQKKLISYWLGHENGQDIESTLFVSESACPFSKTIEQLSSQRELLLGFGIDLDSMRELHHQYHEKINILVTRSKSEGQGLYDEIIAISDTLYASVDKPLQDITATSYMGVHSGIEFLNACSQSIYDSTALFGHERFVDDLRDRLYEQLEQTLGWCIEGMYVGEGEISQSTEFDVSGKIILNDRRINIGVALKDIPNKIYMVEIIQILLEILRQNFQNKEREHALVRLADEAERSSSAKDMFLANMSHELCTPLNAIIGFSQILTMNQGIPPKLLGYIQKIGIAGNSLLVLVNTILDFAKLEAGKLSFKPEITLASVIIREIATIIEPMAQKKSIQFTYPEHISLGLYVDKQLIVQVLLNLLSNAVKFTPDNGKVSLSIDYDETTHTYKVGVHDNGVGIDTSDIATLFDPFTQVENSFQKSTKGTGLGLAIAKRIIEDLHGGQLWVESVAGEGSAFYFTLPVSSSQATLERFVSTAANSKKALIVEDAVEYQHVLVERLRDTFNLTLTNSVNKAKELLEQESFDFIVLDFFLVDGISSEVLQFMMHNGINTPVIIISAEDDSKLIANLPDTHVVEGIFNKTNVNQICDFLTSTSHTRSML